MVQLQLHQADYSSHTPNKVIGTLPPDTCPSKMELSRPARTTLAQLHSRYCRQLGSYMARILPGMLELWPAVLFLPISFRLVSCCHTDTSQSSQFMKKVKSAKLLSWLIMNS